MPLKDLNLDDWFAHESSDEKEVTDIYACLKTEAASAIDKISAMPSDLETIRISLRDFYNSWKEIDPSDKADLRSVTRNFVQEVLKNSAPALNFYETWGDLEFGHIGIEFRKSSELQPCASAEDISTSVAWLVSQLKSQLWTEIPELMTISLRKNTPKPGQEASPLFTVSFSLITKDVSEDLDLSNVAVNEESEKIPEPTRKCLGKFATALIKIVKLKKEPLCVDGLGVFQVDEAPPYKGRNPTTGKSVLIPGQKRLVFRIDRSILNSLT